jgi:hypothetical protein
VRRHLIVAFGLLALAARADGPEAQVVEHHGRWESGYGAKFYNVVGRLKNTSDHALAYVKLRVEVVDAGGKVVASAETYNESAEVLAVELEGQPADPAARLKAAHVKPLPAGAEERFRASFLEDENPPFTDYRVRVVETPAAP